MSRKPPFSKEAEVVVLGSILLDPELIHDANDTLDPDDFYIGANRTIFRAMQRVLADGNTVDLVLLTTCLERENSLAAVGGPGYVATLTDMIPAGARFKHYVHLLKEQRARRELIRISDEIAHSAYDAVSSGFELVTEAEQQIFSITAKQKTTISTAQEGVKQAWAYIEERSRNRDTITGIPTTFSKLDNKLSGLQNTDLIIVAARPSMGKTALAMNIAQNTAINHGTSTAVFSLEQSNTQLWLRMISAQSGVDSHRIRTGFLRDSDWPKLEVARGILSGAPIFVDETSDLRIDQIRSRARRLVKDGCKLVVIDYLGLIRMPKADRTDIAVGEITRQAKAMAKELNIPVILLSQLNRALENRSDKRPKLSDLRESGAIEQDADVVLFIYRDEKYCLDCERGAPCGKNHKGLAEINIAKQRNGPTGMVRLHFSEATTSFKDLDERY